MKLLNDETQKKGGLPDHYLVRSAQRKLYLDGRYTDLMTYVNRPAFRNVAADLVSYFFPYSVKKELSIVATLKELYCFWFALAPSSFKLLGYWRPGWRSSVFNSWVREHIYKFKRVQLGRVPLDFSSADLRDGAKDALITDQKFLEAATEFMPQGVGETARAELVRIIFAPLAFRLQGQDALTAARCHKCGLMWYENEILFLSRKPFDFFRVAWTDLSKSSADVLHWRVSFRCGNVNILIAPHVMKAIKNDIRDILKGCATPQGKISLINKQTQKFYHLGKYSYAAKEQAWALDSWLWRKVGKRITATNPKLKNLYFNLKNAKWKYEFRRPARDTLLLSGISNDEWRQIWNPRR